MGDIEVVAVMEASHCLFKDHTGHVVVHGAVLYQVVENVPTISPLHDDTRVPVYLPFVKRNQN